MRTTIDIDDRLMVDAQRACGFVSKKQTIEAAFRSGRRER
jgi:Arc/MetJ family transcription regulator